MIPCLTCLVEDLQVSPIPADTPVRSKTFGAFKVHQPQHEVFPRCQTFVFSRDIFTHNLLSNFFGILIHESRNFWTNINTMVSLQTDSPRQTCFLILHCSPPRRILTQLFTSICIVLAHNPSKFIVQMQCIFGSGFYTLSSQNPCLIEVHGIFHRQSVTDDASNVDAYVRATQLCTLFLILLYFA